MKIVHCKYGRFLNAVSRQRVDHFNVRAVTGVVDSAKDTFVKSDERFVVVRLDVDQLEVVPGHNKDNYRKEKHQKSRDHDVHPFRRINTVAAGIAVAGWVGSR